jgi:hypothetical protein
MDGRQGIPRRHAAGCGENGSTRGKGIPVRYVVARFAGSGGPEGLPRRFGGRFYGVRWLGLGRFGGSTVLLGHILQPAFELSRVAAIVGLPRGLFRGADVEHGPQGQGIAALVCLAPGRL